MELAFILAAFILAVLAFGLSLYTCVKYERLRNKTYELINQFNNLVTSVETINKIVNEVLTSLKEASVKSTNDTKKSSKPATKSNSKSTSKK